MLRRLDRAISSILPTPPLSTAFIGCEREALDLCSADVRRHRERVGIGDEIHDGRPRMGERILEPRPDVPRVLDPDRVDARGLGDRRVVDPTRG
jgi:hypothetical protein